ncbi:hypothetical protein GCM10010442_82180 [Kitasatospora kifunensis]
MLHGPSRDLRGWARRDWLPVESTYSAASYASSEPTTAKLSVASAPSTSRTPSRRRGACHHMHVRHAIWILGQGAGARGRVAVTARAPRVSLSREPLMSR